MRNCGSCGGRLQRVHRSLLERFRYMAVFECRDCKHREFFPRRYAHHLGEQVRCPECGTVRLVRLRERDRIDRVEGGILNLLERLAGGKLYHCRYCRLQFYDRRKMAAETPNAVPSAGASGPCPAR